MKRMTSQEIAQLEANGASVVRPLVRRDKPEPTAQESPLDSLTGVLRSITTGLEAASRATMNEGRLNEIESRLTAVSERPTELPPPDLNEIRWLVEEEVRKTASPRAEPIKKVEIVRRGRLIDKVKIGGRTVLFKRGQDLSLQSLEFVDA